MARDASRTAEGDLASTPLAHVLVHALDRRLSGTLELREPGAPAGRPHVIALVRGAPARIALEGERERLGDILVERGAIGRELLERFLEEQALARPPSGAESPSEGRMGALLALFGLVPFEEVESAARTQIFRRASRLFALPGGTLFRFVLEDLPPEEGDVAIHPLAFLWAGLREHAAASSKMDALLDGIGERPLALHPAAPIELLELSAREERLVELLARRPRLAELCALAALSGCAPPDLVRALVYALAILRHLDFGPAADGRARPPIGGSEDVESASVEPPSSASSPPGPVTIGRLQLRATALRAGIAAPDEPGAGEPTPFRPGPRSRPPRPPGSGEGSSGEG